MTTTTSVDPAFQGLVNNYFTSNPNVTQSQLANTISTQGGMTPEIAQALANHYGTDVATVNSTYNNLIGNTGAQTANTSASNSPLTANAANTSSATTQTSPLTQLQGVQNTIQGLSSTPPQYSDQQIVDYISQNNLSGQGLTDAEKQFGVNQDRVTQAYQNIAKQPGYSLDPTMMALAGQGNTFAQAMLNEATYNPPQSLFDSKFFNQDYQQAKDNLGINSQTFRNIANEVPLQTTIDNWITAHPNATAADIQKAVGTSQYKASDIQNALSNMAAYDPNSYEATMRSFNTAENLNPLKAFTDYLQKNSTQNQVGSYDMPSQGQLAKEINALGLDPSTLSSLPNNINGVYFGDQSTLPSLAKNLNIANSLAQTGTDVYNLLNGIGDPSTLKKYSALAQVVNAPSNSSDYQNFTKLANSGVDAATYAKATGSNLTNTIASYNFQLDPQARADSTLQYLNLPKGTQYQYGTNSSGIPTYVFTDPTTKQQMAYTAVPGGQYQKIPLAQAQAGNLVPKNTSSYATYNFGQSAYVNPFNSKGQIDTTNAAALDSAYKNNLISMTDYLNAKQALTKKTT